MNPLNKLLKVLMLLLTFFMINNLYAQDKVSDSKVLWQKNFRDKGDTAYCPGQAIYDNKNNRFLIMGTSFLSREKKAADINGELWLWGLDNSGNKISDRTLREVPKELGAFIMTASMVIQGLDITKEGNIIALGKFNGYAQSLLKLDKSGKEVFLKPIEEKPGKENIQINRMIQTPEGNYLLLGQFQGNGFIMKVDSECKNLWQKNFRFDQIGYLLDGIPIKETGNFLITGGSTKDVSTFLKGPSDIRLLLCDSNGNVISEDIFPGASPRVCRVQLGKIAVFYNANSDRMTGPDYKLRIYDTALKLCLEEAIVKLDSFSASFGMVSIPEGGVVIAVSDRARHLLVYEYDAEGKKLNTLSFDQEIICESLNLVCTTGNLFVITQTAPDEKRPYSDREVKIISVQLTGGKGKK